MPGISAPSWSARRTSIALTAEELAPHKTDGHLDVNTVREGAVLICPVKVPGGGIYMGDMHALQGDGEIAGHTCDVAGTVTLEVHVIKGLKIDGPILFPCVEDVPYLARPLTPGERARRKPSPHGMECRDRGGRAGDLHRHGRKSEPGHRQRAASAPPTCWGSACRRS